MDVEDNYLTLKPDKSLKDLMQDAIDDLTALDDVTRITSKSEMQVLADGIKLALIALKNTSGECHGEVPYAPMYPVRRFDGTLWWCCSHKPEHCVPG